METRRRVIIVWVLLMMLINESGGCVEEERMGLLELKAAAFKDGLYSWHGDHRDCCNWEGVSCDNITGSMRVTRLLLNQTFDFSDRRLFFYGSILKLNASLFDPFEELELLDLTRNALKGFNGTLRLKKLRYLDLNFNQFTEAPSLVELPSLVAINFYFNLNLRNLSNLEGAKLEALKLGPNDLPAESLQVIWRMPSLKALLLNGFFNSFNSSIFSGLCNLTNLEDLSIRNNGFDSTIPPCLNNMTLLRTLDLSYDNFIGTIPPSLFSRLSFLERIVLSGNAFEGSLSLASLLANNSRLEAFELVENDRAMSIETEYPLYSPSSQFRLFRLSNCTLNEHRGVVPSFLLKQHELRILELSYIGLKGDFPNWLLENNTKLELFFLMSNSFSGKFNLTSCPSNENMWWIDVSSNRIEGELSSSFGYIFPNLKIIDMSVNSMQGRIPPSMGNMRRLTSLDLSGNNFRGDFPESLIFDCHDLKTLRMSNNALDGQIRSRTTPTIINSSVSWLDLSNNSLTGSVPSWIGDLKHLHYLLLSGNALEGPIPTSFCKLQLTYLDLSDNNSGLALPRCLNVSATQYLHLKNINLTGPFPEFLREAATSLITLDLSKNALSGPVPTWIGSFSQLRILLLRGNNFNGSITRRFCQLNDMAIMDVSYNRFSGTVPSCLKISGSSNPTPPIVPDITVFGMVSNMHYDNGTRRYMSYYASTYSYGPGEGVEREDVERKDVEKIELLLKRRSDQYKGYILDSMYGLDLSSNNLNGSINPKIGYQLNLARFLNLSHNHITGAIPGTFSELKQIESLDLSYNMLSGTIPPELRKLYTLAVFSVAHNNLSGRVPEQQDQFGTFDKTSYEGNPFLCGSPLEDCDHHLTLTPPPSPPSLQHKEDSFTIAFLWSFGGSYVVAFVVVVVFLSLNSYYQNIALNFVYKMMHVCI